MQAEEWIYVPEVEGESLGLAVITNPGAIRRPLDFRSSTDERWTVQTI